jgi:hypothetical protein
VEVSFGGTQALGGGIRRTFQEVELFDDLTVAENVRVAAGGKGKAAAPGRWPAGRGCSCWTSRAPDKSGRARMQPGPYPAADHRLTSAGAAKVGAPLKRLDPANSSHSTPDRNGSAERLRSKACIVV